MIYISKLEKADIEKEFEGIKTDIRGYRKLKLKEKKEDTVCELCKVSHMLLNIALKVISKYSGAVIAVVQMNCRDVHELANYVFSRMVIGDQNLKDSLLKSFRLISLWENSKQTIHAKVTNIEDAYNVLYIFYSKYYSVISLDDEPDYTINDNIISLNWCTIELTLCDGRVKQITRIPKRDTDDFEIGEVAYSNWLDVRFGIDVMDLKDLVSKKAIIESVILNARAGLRLLSRVSQ